MDYIQVSTTTESREDAGRIAAALVERGLAGCVQVIGPIASTYRWQGKIETATEWLCLIKTSKDAYDRVEKSIRELHPYEVPEIIAVPLTQGSRNYLAWLGEQILP
ncbi:MAG: divalent-cation tolerance protein CutA [Syntrophales bacterium]|nr:divalent-cation tolerance protein CutA [Syntrophales bacterium]MDD5232015.1 divalent-cation tolerance protein CutA [Syntrophales bacterium]